MVIDYKENITFSIVRILVRLNGYLGSEKFQRFLCSSREGKAAESLSGICSYVGRNIRTMDVIAWIVGIGIGTHDFKMCHKGLGLAFVYTNNQHLSFVLPKWYVCLGCYNEVSHRKWALKIPHFYQPNPPSLTRSINFGSCWNWSSDNLSIRTSSRTPQLILQDIWQFPLA